MRSRTSPDGLQHLQRVLHVLLADADLDAGPPPAAECWPKAVRSLLGTIRSSPVNFRIRVIRSPTDSTTPVCGPTSITSPTASSPRKEEESGQDVTDQPLGAEADRQADDAGRDHQRPDVDPQLLERHDAHREGHDVLRDVGQERVERAGALGARR